MKYVFQVETRKIVNPETKYSVHQDHEMFVLEDCLYELKPNEVEEIIELLTNEDDIHMTLLQFMHEMQDDEDIGVDPQIPTYLTRHRDSTLSAKDVLKLRDKMIFRTWSVVKGGIENYHAVTVPYEQPEV